MEIWGECGQDVAGYDDEGGDSAQALGNVNLGTGGVWGVLRYRYICRYIYFAATRKDLVGKRTSIQLSSRLFGGTMTAAAGEPVDTDASALSDVERSKFEAI